MNNWGASKWALEILLHSHLPSWWWPVPAASAPCPHALQNAHHHRRAIRPQVRKSASPQVRKPDMCVEWGERIDDPAMLSELGGGMMPASEHLPPAMAV